MSGNGVEYSILMQFISRKTTNNKTAPFNENDKDAVLNYEGR